MQLFPELTKKRWGYVNLDEYTLTHWLPKRHFPLTTGDNPLLNPKACQEMVEEVHDMHGIDCSWGGWMEDRGTLWRGSYLDEGKKYIHLGVDFNVPAGTKVSFSKKGTVLHVDDDHPERHGWGPRVIIKLDDVPIVLIYAHLDLPSIQCRVGEPADVGQVFARVGRAPYNGGWYSHLHVQAMYEKPFKHLTKDGLQVLDGYGTRFEFGFLPRNYPDPMQYIQMF